MTDPSRHADTSNSRSGRPPLSDRWRRVEAWAADSYGMLLALLLIDYVFLSIGFTGTWVYVVASLLISVTGLFAMHASLIRGPMLRAAQGAVVVAIGVSTLAALLDSQRGRGITFALMALLILASLVVVVSRIMQHERVSAETLLGAISVYVLIGLVFACLDIAFQLITGTSYFAQHGVHRAPDFLYFSFITMTTVGYGDLSPAEGFPRTLAVLEALTGQIFLVVLVSRLVALLTPSGRVGGRRARLQSRLHGDGAVAAGHGNGGDNDGGDNDGGDNDGGDHEDIAPDDDVSSSEDDDRDARSAADAGDDGEDDDR